ncbi:MAG: 50S ribosomal protein L4 [Candidatus Marinamargulisbacteria bacterium]
MIKYSIQSIDASNGKSSEVNFESIKVSNNLKGNTYLLNNNQKKTRVVYSFTKSRSDFTSGGAKPFRQKGTGRARQGTSRSPLKVGGSVIFGPKPRFVTRKTNKQFKDSTLKQILVSKVSRSKLFTKINTVEKAKSFCEFVDKDKTYLFLIDINNVTDIQFFYRIKNLPNIYFSNLNSINVEDLIRADEVFYTESSFNNVFKKESGND